MKKEAKKPLEMIGNAAKRSLSPYKQQKVANKNGEKIVSCVREDEKNQKVDPVNLK